MAEGTRGSKEKAESRGFDYTEVAKVWKETYFEGLELAIKGQEEAEQATKNVIDQSFAVPREWARLSRQWVQTWDEISNIATGTHNPWLTISKQFAATYYGNVEPPIKAAEESFETGFSFYEQTVSSPSRKFMRDFSKRSLDAVIPG